MLKHWREVAVAQRCGPPRNVTWIWGSHHKTGSVLLQSISMDIARQGTPLLHRSKCQLCAPSCRDYHAVPPNRTGRRCGTHILEPTWLDPSTSRFIFDLNLHFDAELFAPQLRAFRLARPGIRFLHFTRDPVEQVLSAYFYHRSDRHEAWLRVPNSPQIKYVLAVCRDAATTHELAQVCKTAAARATLSYQGLLQELQPEDGIIVQALQSVSIIRSMAQVNRALAQAPCLRMNLDLDIVTKSGRFEQMWEQAFRFLGVPEASMPQCLRIATHHNLMGPAAQGHVSTSHAFSNSTLIGNISASVLRDKFKLGLTKWSWFQAKMASIMNLTTDVQVMQAQHDDINLRRRGEGNVTNLDHGAVIC